MRVSSLIHSSVVVFALTVPVFGQQTPTRDPQAILVLQQAFLASGGGTLQQVRDTLVQADITYPASPNEPKSSVAIKTLGTDKLRWEGPHGEASVVNQGRGAHFKNGKWHVASSANARNKRIDHLPSLLLAHEFTRNDASLEYIGLESVEGQASHHIRLARVSALGIELDSKLTKDSQIELFVDAKSFLITKISYIYLSSTDWRRGLPLEILFDDYRDMNGVVVPFRQRTFFNGNPMTELRITSFVANVGLLASEFEGR